MNKELLEQIREFVIEIFQQSEAGSMTWREATRLVEELDREIVRTEPEPVAYTSTGQLSTMAKYGGGEMWPEYNKDFESDANEIGSKSKQVALYLHPPRQQEPLSQSTIDDGYAERLVDASEIRYSACSYSFEAWVKFAESARGIGD